MDQRDGHERGVASYRTVDAVVAIVLIAVGLTVAWDSLRLGAGWGEYGPESGYFPFYVGLLVAGASLVTLVMTLASRAGGRHAFVGRASFLSVLKVLIPSILFVALIGFIGIYVAMALFIAIFMRWLGRFAWHRVIAVSLLVPVALFLLFEIWFLVPLPKGPLEAALGY